MTTKDPRGPGNTGKNQGGTGPAIARIIPSPELFRGANEVVIEHAGQHYRLRATSNGKLILTK